MLLSIVGLLAVGTVAGYLGLRGLAQQSLQSIGDPFEELPSRPPAPSATAEEDTTPPVNILLLGSDSRISAGDPTQWSYGAQRTDAILLLHLRGDRQGAFVISIPRDSWVNVPGHGEAKINAAYSWGGPALLIQTVEELTGVHIDHFAVADFESFAALTDSVGGVEITVAEDSYAYGALQFAAGTYLMDGEEALRYARQRVGVPGGDFGRIQRQQNWMRSFARAVLDRNNFLQNQAAMLEFLLVARREVAVDEAFTLDKMRGYLMTLGTFASDQVQFLTVPTQGTGRSPDGRQSIVVLDRERFDAIMAAVREDRLGPYLASGETGAQVLGEAVN